MSREYPWYEIVEGDDIQQGDFIEACKVIIPKYSFNDSPDEITSTNTLPPQIESEYDILNVVIVSQSCDLKNEKVANALVCPRWSYTRVIEKNPKFGSKDTFERIKQGREYRYCMLDKSDLPDLPSEIQIVDLKYSFQHSLSYYEANSSIQR